MVFRARVGGGQIWQARGMMVHVGGARGVGVAVVLAAGPAGAAERWVDTTLAADCGDYDPATRSCGGGDQTAHATLAAADAAATAGDVVTVRAATFTEPFVIGASGSEGAPVVFRAHTDELVTFTGVDSAEGTIRVSGGAWLEISGFVIEDVGSWIRVEDSHHVEIRGNQLRRATIEGTRGSVKLLRSDDCTIEGNTIDDGNDNVTIVDSDRNRVFDNLITRGRHSLISVRCSDANVFRGNIFGNEIQKAAEIYDCEGSSSDDPVIFDSTRRNLWEGNAFFGTAPSDQSHDYNAMQFAGQDGLVRRNVYVGNLGGGVHLQVYPDEALANHGNRVYHNTFHANLCFALGASASMGEGYSDNVVTANLLYQNADCAGGGEQVMPGNPTAASFVDNTLATRDPLFVDPAAGDYSLMDGSPVIDGGPWLTSAAAAGSGTELAVLDARWFYDGGGVEGEVGDVIQLAGDEATARVIAVDLVGQVLTLDAGLTWSAGQGVALAYVGAAPDPGAYEHGLDGPGGTTGDEGESSGDGSTGEMSTSGATTGETNPGETTAGPDTPTGGGPGGEATTAQGESSGTGSGGAQEEAGGCACTGAAGGPRGMAWLLAAALRRRRARG